MQHRSSGDDGKTKSNGNRVKRDRRPRRTAHGGDTASSHMESMEERTLERTVDGQAKTGSSISSLDAVDAEEYLRLVSNEARSLPKIFLPGASETCPRGYLQQSSESGKMGSTLAVGPDRCSHHARSRERVRAGHRDDDRQPQQLDASASPIDGSAAMLHYLCSHRTSLAPCPSAAHLPSQAWIDATLADFSALRSHMENFVPFRMTPGGQKQKRGENAETSCAAAAAAVGRVPVPRMKDDDGWHVFCLGRDEAEGNVGGYFDSEQSDGGEGDSFRPPPEETPPVCWRRRLTMCAGGRQEPTISVLLQLDQVLTRRLLSYHIRWVEEGYALTTARGEWIYGLLARLDKPLHREEQALLRRLLRRCCALRAEVKLESTEETLTGDSMCEDLAILSVLIAVVGVFFEQGPDAVRMR